MFDVVILTDERYVAPENTNQYIENVLREDQYLIDALRKRGISCTKKAWSDPEFEWSNAKAAVFRSTWDYAERLEEFISWLTVASQKTTFINPYSLVEWNLDKHYLRDLEDRNVRIVETYFLEPGEPRTLSELHKEFDLTKSVLKPAISAAAKDTFLLNCNSITDELEDHFSDLIARESMLLQPFQESVMSRGEVSLIMIGNHFSHAVLKVARKGDFRVQDDFGGTIHDYNPTEDEVALAYEAVHACDTLPLYARVDIVTDNSGNPAISELELIEPELWFRKQPEAADRLAVLVKEEIRATTT